MLRVVSNKKLAGAFHLVIDERDVVLASGFGAFENIMSLLPDDIRRGSVEVAEWHPYQELVVRYFRGDKTALDGIARSMAGSIFQLAVWRAMSAIPYGETRSYAALAREAGYPKAVRAVGSACGRNRLALLVPCHRVVRSDGLPGAYLYGADVKVALLDRERDGARRGGGVVQ